MTTTFFRALNLLIMGTGSIKQIGEEAKKLGSSKVLIVTDKVIMSTGLLDKVTKPLIDIGISFDINDEIVPEPPFEMLDEISEKIKNKGYDLFIGIGGGSVLDSTKMLAIMEKNDIDVREMIGTNNVPARGLPFILAPTTSGTGSEVTFNAIFTDVRTQVKQGIVSPYLLPDVAIVDAELTVTVPPHVTAATGMDALVHAVESYTAQRASELTDGIALHALAYPLGGKFKVPHGVANSLLLPYVMKYNAIANLEKFAQVAKALGENIEGLSLRDAAEVAVRAMAKLSRDVGIPSTLSEVGVTENDIPALAEEASEIDRLLNNNPRWLTVKEIDTIYREACAGK